VFDAIRAVLSTKHLTHECDSLIVGDNNDMKRLLIVNKNEKISPAAPHWQEVPLKRSKGRVTAIASPWCLHRHNGPREGTTPKGAEPNEGARR